MFWVTTLFPHLMKPVKGVAITLSWSLLLISQPSLRRVMAAQLSWLWFSVHGLFPVSCSKSSGKRVVGASAGSVLQMNCLKFWRFMKCSIYCKWSLVCPTDDWPYVYILYDTLQMLSLLLCPCHSQTCYNACWLLLILICIVNHILTYMHVVQLMHTTPPSLRIIVWEWTVMGIATKYIPNKQQPIKFFHL